VLGVFLHVRLSKALRRRHLRWRLTIERRDELQDESRDRTDHWLRTVQVLGHPHLASLASDKAGTDYRATGGDVLGRPAPLCECSQVPPTPGPFYQWPLPGNDLGTGSGLSGGAPSVGTSLGW